jgi:hypothetical protein
MLKTIQEWLAAPNRKYAEGLAIFKIAAAPEIKKKYGEYFSAVDGEPDQFDIHYGMLINKVSDIENKMRINPDAFKDLTLLVAPVDNSKEIAAKEAEISTLKATIETLQSKEIESTEIEDNATVISLTEAEEKLLALETELETLKEKRGISIVQYDNLPEDIKKLYDRVKAITPLMASLHADISVEEIHPNTRKSLAKKLCDLDDERRLAWDAIDVWSEGKTVEPTLEANSFSDDVLAKGMQIARRMERLKENINRAKESAGNADRETIKESALKRIEKYEKELAELQALVTPADEQTTV